MLTEKTREDIMQWLFNVLGNEARTVASISSLCGGRVYLYEWERAH